MAEFLTSAEMRAIEAAAIDSFEVSALALMEHAGTRAVAAIFEHWPALHDLNTRAVILCGPGNNGGDGFVMARALRARGIQVVVVHLASDSRPSPEVLAMKAAWAALGSTLPYSDLTFQTLAADLNPTQPLLIIDALFGIGLSRPLGAAVTELWAEFFARVTAPCFCVAVDVPSGVSDSMPDGARLAGFGGADHSVLTITFHAMKDAHRQMHARGEAIRVVDIGLRPAAILPAPFVAALRKSVDAHKYIHGHALVLAGGVGRGGAGRLAARAALRIGAGLVTLACPPAALQENAARLDAVMLQKLRDGGDLAGVLQDGRLNALCLGPALGMGAREEGIVAAALAGLRPTVLDADALTLLARSDRLRAALHPACVLTPHQGEFARLCPDLAALARSYPAKATALAAARLGCVVLLKGARTVIAAPDGTVKQARAVDQDAAPWLATAGAGDVLAGIVTGLLARGFASLDAAHCGALIHQAAARAFGPGLIAEDLADMIPRVLRENGV